MDTNMLITKELPIDDASKKKLVNVRKELFNSDVENLAERLYTGNITIGQWEEQMKALIKGLHTSVGSIGSGGWDNMDPAAWGRVGAEIKKQYRYLHGFAEWISENSDNASIDAIKNRARMYGDASGYTAEVLANQELFSKLPFMPGDGSTECLTHCKCEWILTTLDKKKGSKTVLAVWKLGVAEHCQDCIDRSGYTTTITVKPDMIVPPSIFRY